MTRSWFWERARGKFFERGDMKYMILSLLQEKPKHGYEVIKDLEQHFGGFYSPSPGSIYPTLQMLEDQGYVISTSQDGKRVYSITEEGRAFLSQRTGHHAGQGPHASGVPGEERSFASQGEDVFDEFRVKWEREWAPRVRHEARNLAREFRDLGQTVFQSTRSVRVEPDRLARIRDVLVHAQREIFDILGEEPRKRPEPEQSTAPKSEQQADHAPRQETQQGFEQ